MKELLGQEYNETSDKTLEAVVLFSLSLVLFLSFFLSVTTLFV